MSKTIKLDNQVYQELDQLREKRETFSGTVGRLINFYHEITRTVSSRPEEHPRTAAQRK